MIDALTATCEDLGVFPGMGRRRPELDASVFQVRSIPERNYVIFYAVISETVWIVRVLHGAQDVTPDKMDA